MAVADLDVVQVAQVGVRWRLLVRDSVQPSAGADIEDKGLVVGGGEQDGVDGAESGSDSPGADKRPGDKVAAI